jgi:hypothetical protein
MIKSMQLFVSWSSDHNHLMDLELYLLKSFREHVNYLSSISLDPQGSVRECATGSLRESCVGTTEVPTGPTSSNWSIAG